MMSAHAMWHGSWGFGGFEVLFGFIPIVVTVAFWSLIILLVAKLVRDRPAPGSAPSAALRLLEERYARGEMARDEFLERKTVLLGQSTTPPL